MSNDLTTKNNLLGIFISYAISVQSKNILDLFTVWYQTNLTANEELLTNSIMNTLINDHFLYQKNTDLDSLAQSLPSFVSLFLTITLNEITKPLKYKTLIIFNYIKVLNSCIRINYQLPIMTYNYGYMNPFKVNKIKFCILFT